MGSGRRRRKGSLHQRPDQVKDICGALKFKDFPDVFEHDPHLRGLLFSFVRVIFEPAADIMTVFYPEKKRRFFGIEASEGRVQPYGVGDHLVPDGVHVARLHAATDDMGYFVKTPDDIGAAEPFFFRQA